MGNNIVDFNRNDDYYVETLKMDNYTNLSHLPHILTVKLKESNQLVIKKTFDTEDEAIKYMHEARGYKNNANDFSFLITGPNIYYYQG